MSTTHDKIKCSSDTMDKELCTRKTFVHVFNDDSTYVYNDVTINFVLETDKFCIIAIISHTFAKITCPVCCLIVVLCSFSG